MPPKRATSGFFFGPRSTITSSTFCVPSRDLYGLPVLSIDPLDGGLEFVRQRPDQRKFHDPMKLPKAMDVEGQEVVLDEAPIFSLVLGCPV